MMDGYGLFVSELLRILGMLEEFCERGILLEVRDVVVVLVIDDIIMLCRA